MNGTIRSGELRIRDDLGVEFVVNLELQSIDVEWEPRVPRNLSNAEITAYRRHRDAFIKRVYADTGVSVLVVEL